MIIGKVIGNVWATRKDENLNGFKFMVVEPLDHSSREINKSTFVAVDQIGAGVGETVLVVNGSSARRSLCQEDLPDRVSPFFIWKQIKSYQQANLWIIPLQN
ncbi:ethanolamine utilization protein EutN [Halanaerobium congolense]|uniref:EutN/CcmL family microcompartment protein n=1 Tax=Halanaerobium congolense TaxID=54121 RepID=UPI0008E06E39|nr:EutN/CcmL family microcompartment protein [Halanaerobium congolense]SFP61047.1 ethanolamine utilization protein EutN [Halanaerobium congolense]